VEIY